ncbi:MFS transporter [Pseudonocardia sp. CA-107938]|uniref:MFS transporter n=1 Tax=Pseudonocardia sp. CA-107938 TaxID=3240021 RepID=UPI003D945D05
MAVDRRTSEARVTALREQRARRWHRITVRATWATAGMFFLTGFGYGTWASRVPAVKTDLGLTVAQLAVAFVLLEIGAVLGLQLGGRLVPRSGSRAALRWSMPLFGGTLALLGLAPDLLLLAAAVVPFAVVNSVVDIAINSSGVAAQRALRRPLLSRLHAMHSVGGIAGSAVGVGAAALDVGRTAHLMGAGAAIVVAGLLTARVLLPPVLESDAGPGLTTPDAQRPSRTAAQPAPSGWRHGWTRPLLLLGVAAFCLTFAEAAAGNWSAVYLRDELGSPNAVASAVITVFLAAVAAGRLLGDHLSDRLGEQRLFAVSAVVGGSGLIGALLVDDVAAGFVGFGLLGLGLSTMLPLAIGAAGHQPGVGTGVAVARVTTLGYLGSFVAPAVIGGAVGFVGLTGALFIPAVLMLATAVLSRAVRRS